MFHWHQTTTVRQGDPTTGLFISSKTVTRISETTYGNQATNCSNKDPTIGQYVRTSSRRRPKKEIVLRHLIPVPALTKDENVQCFSDIIVLLAIEKEDELKTVTNIAERAAFREQRGTELVEDSTNHVEAPEHSLPEQNNEIIMKVCTTKKLTLLTNLLTMTSTSAENFHTTQVRSKCRKHL